MDDLTTRQASDHAEIIKRFPNILDYPKQMEKLKDIVELSRQLCTDPIRHLDALESFDKRLPEERSPAWFAGHLRVSLRKELKRRQNKYKPSDQLSLFHPEAFEGGDNTTLRNMP